MTEPMLRLQKYHDSLVAYKIGDIYKERKEHGDDMLPMLTVSIHSGVSDGELEEDALGKRVARSEDKAKYKRAESNDVVFNMMRAWQGAIGVVRTTGMVSPAYIVATPNDRVYPLFMDYYLKTPHMINTINRLSYGLMDFRKRLYWDSFITIDCLLPSIDEQKDIVRVMESVEEIIACVKEEIRLWEEKKKGVMQKLFSREIRFTDQYGQNFPEWMKVKIDDIGSFFGGLSGKTKEDFEHGDAFFIPYKNVYANTFADNNYLIAVDVKKGEKQHAVQYGDILFTQSSENVEEVGLTSVWLHKETPFLNSFCMALRPKNLDQYVPEYMGYVMRSSEIRKQISSQGQGISRINLAASRIKNVEIPIPCKEEQYKISECLIGIDSVISLKIEKLNIWEKIRQGLLQQMFV